MMNLITKASIFTIFLAAAAALPAAELSTDARAAILFDLSPSNGARF